MQRSLAPAMQRLVALFLALGTAGCGGGGGDLAGTSTLTFAPSTDIIIFSGGATVNPGGLVAGDVSDGQTSRTALRFGTAPFLPAGATIISATLRLQQTGVAGNPYTLLGTLVVDHVNFGLTIDGADFSPTVLTPNVGTLSASAALGTVSVDVTSAVAADLLALDFTSDFLLRFTTDLAPNGVADASLLDDSENSRGSGFPPQLIVVYQ